MKGRILIALGLLAACQPPDGGDTNAPVKTQRGSVKLILNDPLQFEQPRDACEAEHCKALLELIDSTQNTLDFAVYGMRNQTAILDAIKRAKERGVEVRGVVDRDLEGNNYYSSTEVLVAAVKDVGSDLSADRTLARREARQKYDREPRCERPPGFEGPLQCLAYDLGQECLLAAHASREQIEGGEAIMHNKFAISDDRTLWTGSTNLSDSGTGGYNANLVTVVESTAVADWYRDEFEQMFLHARYHTLKEREGKRRKIHLDNGELEVLFSPQDAPISRAVRPLLKHANERIDIAVFFLTHKRIVEDLIAAKQRGVKVRVILDATGAKNGYTKHELLRAAGIEVKVENWGGKMHMKSAMIDGRYLVTGSMNWTSSGDFSNDENTIIIDSPPLSAQYGAFFEQLWAAIPERWAKENPDPESKDSTTACTDGVDNDFDHAADTADPGCSDDPPPLPPLPPHRIVPKDGRLTCDVSMDSATE